MTRHLTDADREALTCDCGIMEDDPDWPETFCPFHADRMNLEVSGSADALLATVEAIVARHRAEALREVALAWQTGAWADVLLPASKPPALPALDYGQRVTDWLRRRADRPGSA